jgi:hypothetical protein
MRIPDTVKRWLPMVFKGLGAATLVAMLAYMPDRRLGYTCKNTYDPPAELAARCAENMQLTFISIGLVVCGVALFWLGRKVSGK